MMKQDLIGINAGIIWRLLNSTHQKMNFKELVVKTDLNPMAVAAAIGWLARENKIVFIQEKEDDYFSVYQECYY
ncbi:winged helix-turn-helix domain-containing protein [Bacteroides thetaiotaomicron]|uniref:winged helix-turn-helix domain-containing protein n=1 Tax=Bacteroides thetaiotaomicron TaxID=818 RepID=UPI001E5EB25E|nr:winged helix-turn-helix domain-containing protein [Bacteroides thetaiotaomicron]